jgi:hypothetical protein
MRIFGDSTCRCPHCREQGISRARKLLVLVGVRARCRLCGGSATAPFGPWLAYFMLLMVLTAFPLLTWVVFLAWPWQSALATLAIGTGVALVWMRFVPLDAYGRRPTRR